MVKDSLKQFARTDGLLKGTAIISNLISTACISILPGFGASGLFIANTIQMTIAGVLEVPTGHIADRYGWNQAVKLALWLKVLVTICFITAILSAQAGRPEWIWFFFTLEAIVDSVAGSFLSGAYQAAYLNWYQNKLADSGVKVQDAPPLFLSSFQYALPIRFLLPLIITGIVISLQFLSRTYGVVGPYTVALTSLAFIFALRFVVLGKVYADLRSVASHKRERSPRGFLQSTGIWKECVRSPYFPVYASSVAINMFAIFFLVAQVFRLFNSTGIAAAMVWSCGILFGIGIYFTRTVLGVMVFPKIGRMANVNTIIRLSVFLGFVLLSGGALVTLQPGFTPEFLAFFALAIVSTICTDAIQRLVDSRLDDVVSPQYRATWLSLANGMGMLIFGLLSLQILVFDLYQLSTGFFCLSFFFICILSSVRLSHFVERQYALPSFASTIRQYFLKSTALIIVALALIDILNFSTTAMRIQRETEATVSRLLVNAVEEPLVQGSFVEAQRRLHRLQKDGSFLCAKLSVWEFSADLCGDALENHRLANEVVKDIRLDATSPPIGKVTVYFDKSTVVNAIISRLLFSLLFFLACAVGLILLLRKLGTKIQEELAQVVRLVGDDSQTSGSTGTITVREFGLIAEQLKETVRLRSEVSGQKALNQMATQVSHDLRSPLAALKILFNASPAGVDFKQRELVKASIDRIEEITETMLDSHRQKGRPITAENANEESSIFSASEISDLVRSVVAEEGIHHPPGSGVALECDEDIAASHLQARLQRGAFKRVVSNVLRNAIEAVEGNGRVTIRLEPILPGQLRLRVVDNGKGIPPSIIPKLGERGNSFDKPNGNGLGIWYAKQTVEAWGGSFQIDSQERVGTTVDITLA